MSEMLETAQLYGAREKPGRVYTCNPWKTGICCRMYPQNQTIPLKYAGNVTMHFSEQHWFYFHNELAKTAYGIKSQKHLSCMFCDSGQIWHSLWASVCGYKTGMERASLAAYGPRNVWNPLTLYRYKAAGLK